jgi:DNA polymerase-3 subunit delta'
VLVTARPDVLLPTVRSRCQRIRFGRLSEGEIASVLISAHGYERAGAHAAAAAADGSLGHALEGGSVEFAEAREIASGVLAGVIETHDPTARLALAKALVAGGGRASEREILARRLRALSSLVRDVGVLAAEADDRWLANGDLRPGLDEVRQAWDAGRTLRAFAAIDRALGAIERNASPKVVADWLAVGL